MLDFFMPKVPKSNVDDVKKLLDTKADIVLLDVRTDEEYKKTHIKNSIHVPVDQIEKKVTRILPDKEKEIYVYCLSGSRSVFAVSMMVKLGYTNVFDISSGLLAWRAKQYPLEISK